MDQWWILTLTFVSATLIAVSVGIVSRECYLRFRIGRRFRAGDLANEIGGANGVSLFRDINRFDKADGDETETWLERLGQQLEQARLTTTPVNFLLTCLGLGVALGAVGLLRSPMVALALAAGGCTLPFLYLRIKRFRMQQALTCQLPEVFQMVSRAVRAGQTIPAALQTIADDFEQPVAEEFARCQEQQNLGISKELALRQLAKRAGVMELQLFVVALLVQSRSGGDLVELLDNLSAMIRRRLKLKDRVRALTGEGRTQAAVLFVLPFAALLGLMVFSPDYASVLLERPWLLMGTLCVQLLGVLWVRKIVNFEY